MNKARAILALALLIPVSPLGAETGSLRIHVVDTASSVLPGAQVTLLGPKDKLIRTLSTDKEGVLVWENPPLGESRFRVSVPGFYSQELSITFHSADYEQKLEVILQPNNTDYYDVGPPKRKWWQIFR